LWKPYLNVLTHEVSDVIYVPDRLYVIQPMNKKMDEVLAEEARQLKRDSYEPSPEPRSMVSVEATGEPNAEASGEVG
jgi:hypothetical protein